MVILDLCCVFFFDLENLFIFGPNLPLRLNFFYFFLYIWTINSHFQSNMFFFWDILSHPELRMIELNCHFLCAYLSSLFFYADKLVSIFFVFFGWFCFFERHCFAPPPLGKNPTRLQVCFSLYDNRNHNCASFVDAITVGCHFNCHSPIPPSLSEVPPPPLGSQMGGVDFESKGWGHTIT